VAQAGKKLVFVAMPFGKKRDPQMTYEIDFDAIYQDGIRPAVDPERFEVVRADEERGGDIIHKLMFERLLLAEIAIVDVTLENANVFYELGVRHAALPRSTIILRAKGTRMPFDINMLRAVTYELTDGVLSEKAAGLLHERLRGRLDDAFRATTDAADRDSPLFTLIEKFPGIALPQSRETESFRDRARRVDERRERLARARLMKGEATAAIRAIEEELGGIDAFNVESAVDVMLSYRDVQAWPEMIALIERFPVEVRDENTTIREQYGLALNRRAGPNDKEHALAILEAVVAERGDNPETCGIIGRVYKDYYTAAKDAGSGLQARTALRKAIEWYRRGFIADPRDSYPGINLATLLLLEGSDAALHELPKVAGAVSFALVRQQALNSRDYWTLATVLEAAVLGNDWDTAETALGNLLLLEKKPMQLTTTRNNLALIHGAKPPHIDAGRLREVIDVFSEEIRQLEASASPSTT
jgi:hypothetical protein